MKKSVCRFAFLVLFVGIAITGCGNSLKQKEVDLSHVEIDEGADTLDFAVNGQTDLGTVDEVDAILDNQYVEGVYSEEKEEFFHLYVDYEHARTFTVIYERNTGKILEVRMTENK